MGFPTDSVSILNIVDSILVDDSEVKPALIHRSFDLKHTPGLLRRFKWRLGDSARDSYTAEAPKRAHCLGVNITIMYIEVRAAGISSRI